MTVLRTGERHRSSNGRTNGNRENRWPNREEQRSGPSAGTASDSQRQVDPGAHQRAENGQSVGISAARVGPLGDRHGSTAEANQDNRLSADQTKRKGKTDARNRARRNKRARTETEGGSYQNRRELQILVAGEMPAHDSNSAVPWEHRGLLGQTREGRPRGSDTS